MLRIELSTCHTMNWWKISFLINLKCHKTSVMHYVFIYAQFKSPKPTYIARISRSIQQNFSIKKIATQWYEFKYGTYMISIVANGKLKETRCNICLTYKESRRLGQKGDNVLTHHTRVLAQKKERKNKKNLTHAHSCTCPVSSCFASSSAEFKKNLTALSKY